MVTLAVLYGLTIASLEATSVSAQRSERGVASHAERAAARAEKRAAARARRVAAREARRAARAAERAERNEQRKRSAASRGSVADEEPESADDESAAPSPSGFDPEPERDELEEDSEGASEGVIGDPELAGVESSSSAGEVVEDPELADSMSSSSGGTSFSKNNTGQAKLELHSRVAADLYRADPREEVWESITIVRLETTLRRSETLRFVLGVRAQYRWATLANDVLDAKAERIELDAAPTAGFVDINLQGGLHLQLGYQPVHLGRFDLLSATDVLSVYDLREWSALLPDTSEVGQLAVRVDYAASSLFSLHLVYVPFFTPHIVSVVESDYALFRTNQTGIDATLSELGLTSTFAANLTRADRARIAESTLAAFAPEATFMHPQAAARFDLYGTLGGLGFTAATALDHLPNLRVSQELIDASLDPSADAQERLAAQPRPVTLEYERFAVFSIDASVDLAPLLVGVELAYMLNRTLWAVGEGAFPRNIPIPSTANIAHAGLRAEYVATDWVFVMESFFSYVLDAPPDPQLSWMFLESGRWTAGLGAVVSWTSEFGLGLDVAAFGLTGYSLFFMPRLTYDLFEGLELELGALIVEGRTPPATITPNLTLGGMFDTVDSAFFGLHYVL